MRHPAHFTRAKRSIPSGLSASQRPGAPRKPETYPHQTIDGTDRDSNNDMSATLAHPTQRCCRIIGLLQYVTGKFVVFPFDPNNDPI